MALSGSGGRGQVPEGLTGYLGGTPPRVARVWRLGDERPSQRESEGHREGRLWLDGASRSVLVHLGGKGLPKVTGFPLAYRGRGGPGQPAERTRCRPKFRREAGVTDGLGLCDKAREPKCTGLGQRQRTLGPRDRCETCIGPSHLEGPASENEKVEEGVGSRGR